MTFRRLIGSDSIENNAKAFNASPPPLTHPFPILIDSHDSQMAAIRYTHTIGIRVSGGSDPNKSQY